MVCMYVYRTVVLPTSSKGEGGEDAKHSRRRGRDDVHGHAEDTTGTDHVAATDDALSGTSQ